VTYNDHDVIVSIKSDVNFNQTVEF
jgi:hypothetical protein